MSYKDSLKNRWSHMRERCENPKHARYADFGGRGIKVCPEWRNYESFFEWSMMNGYSPELELSRININGDFSPSNCRFTTPEQQCNNRRTSRIETYRETTDTLINLCRIYNKNYNSVRAKVSKGATIAYAMDSTDKCFVVPDHSDPEKVKKAKTAKAKRTGTA